MNIFLSAIGEHELIHREPIRASELLAKIGLNKLNIEIPQLVSFGYVTEIKLKDELFFKLTDRGMRDYLNSIYRPLESY